MDVYFERIAGVAERSPPPEEQQAAPPPPEPHEVAGLDDNGFPLNPLKEQDQLWFIQAAELYKPLERASRTARASGTLLIVGGISSAAIGGATFDVVTIVIGLIMATLGTLERSAASDMSTANIKAATKLGRNQLMLFGLIALYCTAQVKMFQSSYTGEFLDPRIVSELQRTQPQLGAFVGQIEAAFPTIVYGGLALVVALSLVFQGFMSMYYFSRRSKIRSFHSELPPWVTDIVKTVTSG